MKPLTDECPDASEVLKLGPEKLGQNVLGCLSGTNEPNIERAIIAKTLASGYHQSFQRDVAKAIETAIDWLLGQCLLGASPYNRDLVMLTGRGQADLAERLSEYEKTQR